MSNLAVTPVTAQSPLLTPSAPQLPLELWKYIFTFGDRNESLKNGFICRDFRVLSLEAWKESLIQQIQRLITTLKNQKDLAPFTKDLEAISESFSISNNSSITSPEQIDQSFWSAAGKILAVLKKLTPQVRERIEKAIHDQIPPSLNMIFALADLSLVEAVQMGNTGAFSIVFSSCLSLAPDHDDALLEAAKIGNILMLRVLATDTRERVHAAEQAWKSNHRACVEWLLTTDLVLRYRITFRGIKNRDIELVRFLQDKGSISETDLSALVGTLIEDDLPEYIPLLLARNPITNVTLMKIRIKGAIDKDKLHFLPLLLTYVDVSPSYLTDFAITAIRKNNFRAVELLLARGPTDIHLIDSEISNCQAFNDDQRSALKKLLWVHNYWKIQYLQISAKFSLFVSIAIELIASIIITNLSNHFIAKVLSTAIRVLAYVDLVRLTESTIFSWLEQHQIKNRLITILAIAGPIITIPIFFDIFLNFISGRSLEGRVVIIPTSP